MSAINLTIFRWINNLAGTSTALDFIMKALSSQYLWIGVALCAVIASIRIYPKLRKPLVQCALAIALSDQISFEVVKPFVKHERPCWTRENVKLPTGFCGGSYGFTSNHAANAGAAAGVLTFAQLGSKIIIPIWALAVSVGISRIYLGVHEPVDIAGGLLLGVFISLIVLIATRKVPADLFTSQDKRISHRD